MVRHPAKKELLAYAEGLIDGNVNAAVARHVTQCPTCKGEVQSIRQSFETVRSAHAIQPSIELSRRIITQARAARPKRSRLQRAMYRSFALAKGMAFVAGVSVVCAVWFTATLSASFANGSQRPASANAAEPVDQVATEELRRATVEIETLAGAVIAREHRPESRREWHYARRLVNVNAQLSAAQAAFERNPSNPRAMQVVDTGLKRQRDALITLIRERSL